MQIEDIARVAIVTAFLVGGAVRLYTMWSGRELYAKVPLGWPFGDAGWRAVTRTFPVNYAIAVCLVVAYGLIQIASEHAVFDALAGLASLAAFVLFGVSVHIALVNRPSALVLPRFRGEPGLLDLLRASRGRSPDPDPPGEGPDASRLAPPRGKP